MGFANVIQAKAGTKLKLMSTALQAHRRAESSLPDKHLPQRCDWNPNGHEAAAQQFSTIT